MTEHKPSQADAAHIAAAEYRRAQNAALERKEQLKAARLAQSGNQVPISKGKRRAVRHVKTRGFGRWS
jgi:hypothetical protein